jgi:hypothetical protein
VTPLRRQSAACIVVLPERNDVPIACPRESIVFAALFVPPSDGSTLTVYWVPEPAETTRLGSSPILPVSPAPDAEHPPAASTRTAALMIARFTFALQFGFEQA